MIYGDFLALLGGVTWALTTISLRLTKLSEVPPTQTLFYQLLGAFIILLPIAYCMGQTTIQWTAVTIWSMVFHIFIMSLFSLILWFWLLKNYLANALGGFSFLTPIFGMIFGIVFLHEHIELNFILGSLLVMCGIFIVSLHQWIKRIFKFAKLWS